MTEQASPDQSRPSGRASRWGLYLPFVLFGVICAAWSAYWFVARSVVIGGIDRAIADAAGRGDQWSCVDRSVTGFPFRIEVRCSGIRLARSAAAGVVALTTGPVVAVGQPQTPGHVIVQAQGPASLRFADGTTAELRWEQLEASHRARSGQLERTSLNLKRPVASVRPAQGEAVTVSSQQLEAHLRRNPSRAPGEQALDLVLRAGQLASSHLDALFGDTNASEVDLQVTAVRADLLAHGFTPAALEQWRLQLGKLDVTRFALAKGIKRVEARGEIALDEQRRPSGRIEPSVANIDQFAGIRLRGGAMDLMSALSGRQGGGADGLRPLPALEMREGRVAFGPVRLPGVRLDPLY